MNVSTASTPRTFGSDTRHSSPKEARLHRPMSGPLAGMRVLELAQIMAGPTSGLMLADMGADVIKVEKLPGGDDSRGYTRTASQRRVGSVHDSESQQARYRSNLKHAEGREILLRLVARRRRADRKLSQGHAGEARPRLRRAGANNPGLIYCAVSGYGRDGPFADKGGFDLIAQGFAGLMSITGEPGGAPVKTGNSGRRHQRRHPRRCWHSRCVRAQAEDRRGPDRRYVANRSSAATNVLARCNLFRHRPIAGPDRLGASPDRAVSGVSRERRLDQHRRRQSGELGADCRRVGPSRVARRSALRDQFGAHGESRRPDDAMNKVLTTRTRKRVDRTRSTPPAYRSDPSHSIGEALAHPQTLARGMVVDLIIAQAGKTRALAARCTFHARRLNRSRSTDARRAHARSAARVRISGR